MFREQFMRHHGINYPNGIVQCEAQNQVRVNDISQAPQRPESIFNIP